MQNGTVNRSHELIINHVSKAAKRNRQFGQYTSKNLTDEEAITQQANKYIQRSKQQIVWPPVIILSSSCFVAIQQNFRSNFLNSPYPVQPNQWPLVNSPSSHFVPYNQTGGHWSTYPHHTLSHASKPVTAQVNISPFDLVLYNRTSDFWSAFPHPTVALMWSTVVVVWW